MGISPVIFIDDREPPRIADQLAAYGCTVSTGHFESGDYILYPHGLSIGIERKTISNMLGSMSTNQIVTQAHRLIESFDLAIILREGAFRRGSSENLEYHDPKHPDSDATGWIKSGWAWSSWQGMQFDLQLMGLLVWDCPVLGEAARDLAAIAASLQQDSHKWIKERERPNVLALDRQWRDIIWAGCAFQGMGPETVEAVIRQLGSYAIFIDWAANRPDDLAALKVNGRKLGVKAQGLHKQVTEKYG